MASDSSQSITRRNQSMYQLIQACITRTSEAGRPGFLKEFDTKWGATNRRQNKEFPK